MDSTKRLVTTSALAVATLLPLATSATATPTAATTAPTAAASATATTKGFPPDCYFTVGEPTGEAYRNGQSRGRILTWLRFASPRTAQRHGEFTSFHDPEEFHRLTVTPDGVAYDVAFDSTLLYGELGGNDKTLPDHQVGSVRVGTTLKNIVDLDHGFELPDKYGDDSRPTSRMYALTKDGKLWSIPMTYTKKQRPVLGKPVQLKVRGLGALRGIETSIYRRDKKGIVEERLLAHTASGQLVEITVDRKARTPRIARVKTLASSGWKNVSNLSVGWCDDNSRAIVVTSIDSSKRVVARVDPDFVDSSLKGSKAYDLGRWQRGPLNTLF